MASFYSALSFLSILPPFENRAFDGRMVGWFPLVGLLIGGLLVGVDGIGGLLFPDLLRCVVDVLFLAMITGALHLDGLADSADGLFSHRPRHEALDIMRDPRMGVMGGLAVMFCILLKVGGILGLDADGGWLWLLAAPALARSASVIALVTMQDARNGEGIGSSLYQNGKYHLGLTCLVPIGLPFAFDAWTGILIFIVFAVVTGLLLFYFHRKIGGMTGDTIGALTEIVETLVLVAGSVAFFRTGASGSL